MTKRSLAVRAADLGMHASARVVTPLLPAAVLLLFLFTGSCSAVLVVPAHSARVGRPGPSSPQHRVHLVTEASYTASLVHWIDSLAGTSGGKTIPIYQDLWQHRFGRPGVQDRRVLRSFAAARLSVSAQSLCGSPPAGATTWVGGWRLAFLYHALESHSVDEFRDRVRPCLTEEEARGLDAALDHFTPGFNEFWRRGAYLQAFETRYRMYLAHPGMLDYLDEVAAFFGVDPSMAPPATLCFVLLPFNGPTHAQTIGSRLLIEVRPEDAPTDQTQVVAHETAHYLFEMMPPARIAALEARARSAGDSGTKAWLLLQEALPTALGQGLAVARLTPGVFDPDSSWYHIAAVDRFAKRIYPLVRSEIEAGRTIEGPFLEQALRAYRTDEEPR